MLSVSLKFTQGIYVFQVKKRKSKNKQAPARGGVVISNQ